MSDLDKKRDELAERYVKMSRDPNNSKTYFINGFDYCRPLVESYIRENEVKPLVKAIENALWPLSDPFLPGAIDTAIEYLVKALEKYK